MHDGQDELGGAGVSSRQRHITVCRVGEVDNDGGHRGKVRSSVDEL